MVHLVEVRRIGRNLTEAMKQMRAWLDRTGIEAALFDHSAGGAGITFRLGFSNEDDASAFAAEFAGRLLTDPCGGALWEIR